MVRGYCTPRWLPAVFNEAVFSGVSMAAEKTFSRINAGKSILFLGRLTRCAQYPRTIGAPTSDRKLGSIDAGSVRTGVYLRWVSERPY